MLIADSGIPDALLAHDYPACPAGTIPFHIMNVSTKGTAAHTYDAIVVGSGISGGWAAKELTEKGLNTLVLERGRDVKHGDYPTAMMEKWEFPGRNTISQESLERKPKQSRTGYTTRESTAHWFVDDVDNPYSCLLYTSPSPRDRG